MKLAVLVGGISYFILGMRYTLHHEKFTNSEDPELDEIIQNLIFLYAFAGFDFHLELFSLFDDTDGTSHCKSTYQFKLQEDDMEILLHGRPLRKEYANRLQREEPNKRLEPPSAIEKTRTNIEEPSQQ